MGSGITVGFLCRYRMGDLADRLRVCKHLGDIHMARMVPVFLVVQMGLIGLSVPCHGEDAEPASSAVLWEIGQPDGTANEFALAPEGFARFSYDGFYHVGVSDASRDWPYAHPSPSDRFGGQRPHTFTIVFSLASVPEAGGCRLECRTANAHQDTPPHLRFDINGKTFDRRLEAGTQVTPILRSATEGHPQQFFIEFPSELLREGENRVAISNLAGSWFLYDYVALTTPPGAALDPEPKVVTYLQSARPLPALFQDGAELCQGVRLEIRHLGEPCQGTVGIGEDPAVSIALRHGPQFVDVRHRPVTEASTRTVRLAIDDSPVGEASVDLKPVRPWVVYLLHHTHLDIGYTHTQPDVERVQWKNLEQALDLIDATRDLPTGAQFKWLPEGMWALESYLDQAAPAARERFFEAIRAGRVGLDALYGNELTALCRPEELLELPGYARRIADAHDLPLDSAMITDVPGYTWGLVPALALSGIHYLSIGPNASHRIGYTLSTWGDRPFYWISPSGEDRVLCWMAGKAYSWFHRGPLRDDQGIFDYLDALDQGDYPYDMVQVRYNIGGDNGPPDPGISDFVKQWNETYAYPKLLLATSSEAFHAFEEEYGAQVPEVRGDFTPYWEDGAASSARETALNRASAERLVQAEILWSLAGAVDYPGDAFAAAWRNALLYDEHTWGAHNSISEPQSDFAQQQWTVKQAFATDADAQSKELLSGAVGQACRPDDEAAGSVMVFNTLSWPRTDVVVLPAQLKRRGDRVEDDGGNSVPSQRLSNGDLAFLAHDVPALGAARYTVHEGEQERGSEVRVEGSSVSSSGVSVRIDETTGAIASILAGDAEYVDSTGGIGLNEYLYVAGRDPKDPQRNGAVTIRTGERGPGFGSLIVESAAPGCRALTREVRLIAGLDRIDLIDTIDKEAVYDPEAVHLAFPFAVPGGVVRMDIPWAVVRPDVDQLEGACKNYFTVQRWADISNDTRGVTWATLDAPLIELGAITNDPRIVGWIEHIGATTTLYSYVMNNYWETNYKAAQDGPTVFRYALRFHGAYDQADAQCFGVERSQPLIAAPAAADDAALPSRLQVSPKGVLVTSIRPGTGGQGWILRLFNGNDQAAEATLTWGGTTPSSLRSQDGTIMSPAGDISMPPYGIATLDVVWE